MKNLGTYQNDLSVPRKKDVDSKQDKIKAAGILQGDGAGNVTSVEKIEASAVEVPNGILKGTDGTIGAAVAGTDYVTPDDIPSDVLVIDHDDITYADVKAAHEAGKAVICNWKNVGQFQLSIIYDTYITFERVNGKGPSISYFELYSDHATGMYLNPVVPSNRTINGKALSANITLGAVYTATLLASEWEQTSVTGWTSQTVTVSGLKATYNAAPFVDVALTGTDATGDAELSAAWMAISATAIADTAANSITVKFPGNVESPAVNIPIRITVYD